MSKFYSKREDYDSLKKLLSADNINQNLNVKPSIITSLDDVFSNFELLVEAHPFHSGTNINVYDYLMSTVKKPLSDALKNGDSYAVNTICFKVGQAFRPSYSAKVNIPLISDAYIFLKEKKDEFAFREALRKLINKYKDNKITF
jgi:hypothetical protein